MPSDRSTRLPGLVDRLPRRAKQLVMLASDTLLLVFSCWAAYSLRLGMLFVPNTGQLLLMLAAPALALPVFARVGLYRSVIRYLGEQALWSVFVGISIAAALWAMVAFMTQSTGLQGVPRGVLLLYWILGGVLVGGTRFLARWALWSPLQHRLADRQVLIYGAGSAGRQLAASLRRGRDMYPAGFLDDDPSLHGEDIEGLRVHAPTELPRLIERFGIRDAIVTMPTASGLRQREVVETLKQHRLRVRILPAVSDIASGHHLVSLVREVDIGDLLGRDPVEPDPRLLGRCIAGRVVLVTGAGGSIGSELSRQIVAIGPARLVLLEAHEHSLYEIDRRMRAVGTFPVDSHLGSVRDVALMKKLLSRHAVHTVYHAAAHKHVPLVEDNVLEGAANNVLGTLALVQEARGAGVESFVLISSDKAVRPTNVMGATKRWGEMIVQESARRVAANGTGQRFCAVRFGNVVGSSGSVIPLFKEQIAQGGPVTVTDPAVTRYFMSVHEAVQLVIQAGSLSTGGEVFLLDMGEPVQIYGLACNMIRLAGHTVRNALNPDGDIEIVFTGLRPGEKQFEELLIADGKVAPTRHPKIRQAEEPLLTGEAFDEAMDQLRGALEAGDESSVRGLLLSTARSGRAQGTGRE